MASQIKLPSFPTGDQMASRLTEALLGLFRDQEGAAVYVDHAIAERRMVVALRLRRDPTAYQCEQLRTFSEEIIVYVGGKKVYEQPHISRPT